MDFSFSIALCDSTLKQTLIGSLPVSFFYDHGLPVAFFLVMNNFCLLDWNGDGSKGSEAGLLKREPVFLGPCNRLLHMN